ncbi:cationic peroxidase 2-like [Panicum miliaceum]|uniref:Cationic peroxidase 2-like n=1 Tax=Panicum miliaceum TaxID=4540 RepID=A0A3L6T8H4_PANMI|nr:cationic peroxidase 2-like [Panicum miliaceum]
MKMRHDMIMFQTQMTRRHARRVRREGGNSRAAELTGSKRRTANGSPAAGRAAEGRAGNAASPTPLQPLASAPPPPPVPRGSAWDPPVKLSSSGGRFSDEADATRLPNPEFVFPILKDSFARRGLGVADLVALSGAHTLGEITCLFVSPRLCAFRGNSGVDPFIDPGYAQELMRQCPTMASTNRVVMNPGTSCYAAIKANGGVLLTDSVLTHGTTTMQDHWNSHGRVHRQTWRSAGGIAVMSTSSRTCLCLANCGRIAVTVIVSI